MTCIPQDGAAIGRHDELAELLLGGKEVASLRKHSAKKWCHVVPGTHPASDVYRCAARDVSFSQGFLKSSRIKCQQVMRIDKASDLSWVCIVKALILPPHTVCVKSKSHKPLGACSCIHTN